MINFRVLITLISNISSKSPQAVAEVKSNVLLSQDLGSQTIYSLFLAIVSDTADFG